MLPFQIDYFVILFSLLIISVGTLGTRERCIILEITKVLKIVLFCILFNFSTFSFLFRTCLIKFSSVSRFLFSEKWIPKTIIVVSLNQYSPYHRVPVRTIPEHQYQLFHVLHYWISNLNGAKSYQKHSLLLLLLLSWSLTKNVVSSA